MSHPRDRLISKPKIPQNSQYGLSDYQSHTQSQYQSGYVPPQYPVPSANFHRIGHGLPPVSPATPDHPVSNGNFHRIAHGLPPVYPATPRYSVRSSNFHRIAEGLPPVNHPATLRDVPIFSSRTGVIRFEEDDPRVSYSDYLQQREAYASAKQREGVSVHSIQACLG